MSAFKVGDRVVVVSSDYERCKDQDPNLAAGNTGVISEVLLYDVFLVEMDEGPRRTPPGFSGWAFYGRELRHENERVKP